MSPARLVSSAWNGGQHGCRRCRGFTLVELVLVTVILAIFASVAVPRYANFVAQQHVDAAARRIKTDLTLAQRKAKFSSTSQEINFCTGDDSYYEIVGMQDPDHPAKPYVVSLLDEPYRAKIVSAAFGGDAEVVFDGYGMPDSGGTIVIRSGTFQRTITVDADTGTVKPPVKGEPIEE